MIFMKVSIIQNGVYDLESVVIHSRILKQHLTFNLRSKDKKAVREALNTADYNGNYNPSWAASSQSPKWRISSLVYLAKPKFKGDENRERRELSYSHFRDMDLNIDDTIFFRTTIEAKKYPET